MKFLPERRAITSFGDGGFRFGDHSHRGNILMLPSGIRAWDGLDFASVFDESDEIDFLVLGTGLKLVRQPSDLLQRLQAAAISADAMSTSAAVHSYNLMFGEARRVAAALLAVA